MRQHGEGLQIYLLKRSAESGFFPGNYVFPGGGVGSPDQDPHIWQTHADGSAGKIAEGILPYYVAAIRETFEEAGVFLGTIGESASDWFEKARNERASDGLPKGWLRDCVVNRCCLPGFSLLFPWSHWITPEGMPRRFDTRFFMAVMPPEQACSPDRREAVDGVWISPEEALIGNLRSQIPLSPPTLVTLQQLLTYKKIEDLEAGLKGRGWGEPIVPRLVRLSRGAMIVEPWDPMYDREFEVDADRLESGLVPLPEPFSRIWFHEGVWRPVRVQDASEKAVTGNQDPSVEWKQMFS
jgi:8-oxo-dGTP pyrophosphatase MutT (NUDIX family)